MSTETQFPAFEEIYSALQPKLEVLETLLQKGLRRERIYLFISFVGVLTGSIAALNLSRGDGSNNGLLIMLIAIGGVLLLLGLLLRYEFVSKYRLQFKQKIISEIVEAFGPTFSYKPQSCIERSTFLKTKIFPSNMVDDYKGEDLIIGKVGLTDFRLCELEIKNEDGDETETIFKGLFFQADFHKHFKGRTLILPKSKERIHSIFYDRFSSLRAKRVRLEDVDFDRRFIVYGTNQVEARYILSLSMMRNIQNIAGSFYCPVYISFYKDFMFLAMDWSRDLFELKFKNGATDKKSIKRFYDELMLCLKLIDDLNLNTRIWSKRP